MSKKIRKRWIIEEKNEEGIKESSYNSIPSDVLSLLWEFGDVFTKEPSGLPSIQGIEHQTQLVHRALIPNNLTYRSNLKKTKGIQRQVEELLLNMWERA